MATVAKPAITPRSAVRRLTCPDYETWEGGDVQPQRGRVGRGPPGHDFVLLTAKRRVQQPILKNPILARKESAGPVEGQTPTSLCCPGPGRLRRSRTRDEREPRVPSHLIDVGPAAVSLEHDLATFAAKDDLEVTPPYRCGVPTANGTRCSLVLERNGQGLDLDL
jgi:hypothetical protein